MKSSGSIFNQRTCDPCGFTLLELLAVIGVIVLLAGLTAPAILGINGSRSTTRAVYEIASQIEQARAYAVANNTYVLVGIAECKAGAASLPSPQVSGVGRVVVSSVASKDGTKIFDETSSDIEADWKKKTDKGTGLVQIGKLVFFDNLHLTGSIGGSSASALAARPAVEPSYQLGSSQCDSALKFSYPVETSPSSGLCQFSKVIQFSPQGAACILRNDNFGMLAPWIEVGLSPTRGGTVVSDLNIAAIQINGITGSTAVYRP